MAIPPFSQFLLPLLQYSNDGKEHSIHEATEALANTLAVSEDDLRELVPSGNQRRFVNRVSWARTYLAKALLLESKRRAHFQITERGRKLLAEGLDAIDKSVLSRYPEFQEFNTHPTSRPGKETVDNEQDDETPEEQIDRISEELRSTLIDELLDEILGNSPNLFERLVVQLLTEMGYGGNRRDAGQALGKSGDEGIDGAIKEDRLGLDAIYIQAKRWQREQTVSRPEVQRFSGALSGQRAKKGVFITTSSFSKKAIEFADRSDPKIVLIDGRQLAGFMIDFNVGVTQVQAYQIKRIDSDFFGII